MKSIRQWFDNGEAAYSAESVESAEDGIDWLRVIPFLVLHLACLAVFFVGISAVAVLMAVALYLIRMFAITAFYHRYFAHKSFKTTRPVQFLFALIGASATQRGPLWWAAHHRQHHRHADQPADPHSPKQGFFWSHMGWFLSGKHYQADYKLIPDWQRFSELRWLDRYDLAVPVLLALALFILGVLLEKYFPGSGTSGWQMLVWGYFISTVVLLHATLLINSMAHCLGKKRYQTADESRNNLFLALLTLGEGWHNNHHHYPASARQGFYWWEVDISYYILKLMQKSGLIWDVRTVPLHKRESKKILPEESV
ncbi:MULTISPECIES: acyl-CoA desaturase [unclassified Methylophaga]|jgi:stearoyl-CoA desaturase (delta-9 desaturase)|uniref:acyl-CoA desaturase n=1 Tax=unclassified Methylophaga TaxID=2629249 RepID=UPI000C8AB9A1|nr:MULTISPECIES: acyl-CoA desaturase [unclassified Methylophaga]MAY16573.1 acyl-CoA desaturase [Methylophaga sp.]HAO24318.1 acyl-CoA desaturase [Methylophaga sp.]|tara:strand:+ start:2798 stop:3730 length:933 start_codon:yes stop_codon:yes gene_type:complete